MTDFYEKDKDLLDNITPFSLLDEETQNRLLAWPYGWKVWQHDGTSFRWLNVSGRLMDVSNDGLVYRAKRAPEPEPVEVRHEVSITVESPLLPKEMHYRLSFDEKLENPKIEAIE